MGRRASPPSGRTRTPCAVELGYALCRAHRSNTAHADCARGRASLQEVALREPGEGAVETPAQRQTRAEARHRLAWAFGNMPGEERKARDAYRAALDLDPGNPYYLAAYLGYEVFCSRNRGLGCMRDYVMQAIATCQAHIEVGIEQPRAQFTMGRLYLLLNDVPKAMDAYLRGIRLLMVLTSYTPVSVLDDELRFLASINFGENLPPRHDQIGRLLKLARAAKRLQTGEPYDLTEAMSAPARAGGARRPSPGAVHRRRSGADPPSRAPQTRDDRDLGADSCRRHGLFRRDTGGSARPGGAGRATPAEAKRQGIHVGRLSAAAWAARGAKGQPLRRSDSDAERWIQSHGAHSGLGGPSGAWHFARKGPGAGHRGRRHRGGGIPFGPGAWARKWLSFQAVAAPPMRSCGMRNGPVRPI